jgi:hypothetical protein
MNRSRSSNRRTRRVRRSKRTRRSSSRRTRGRISRRRIGGWGSTSTKDNKPFLPSLLSGGWGEAPKLGF